MLARVEVRLPKLPPLEYGRCPCGGVYEARQVPVEIGAQQVVLIDVPRATCRDCKGQVYKARVLELIEQLYGGSERPA